MEELIGYVNKLQDVFAAGVGSEIDLPQIVVVGTQSAGKSSVLEHIVGKSFLPRGHGVVTRCPLVLQLEHAPDQREEYATFQHEPNRKFREYDSIRQEIEDRTEELAGENKGICHGSINLKIVSPSVLTLTLVDLPGLTKVAVGDQPQDIEQQTRALILKYIENPNSIILAVTPANVDMATSDSIKLAKEVDPKGTRTLAVLTKLDLMDKGTNAWDMLHGKVIPVKLGIIGVVNRSQRDINDGKSIEESMKEEAAFLQENYKSIAAKHGSPYLTKTVQAILVKHIQNCMPELKKRIVQKLTSLRNELSRYAKCKMDSPTLLLNLIFKFTNLYISEIKGHKISLQTDGLYGGARIHAVFQDGFAKEIRGIDSLAGLKKSDILSAITNVNCLNPAIFVPEKAFELLSKKQIEQFRKPSLTCVELVHEELVKIAQCCLEEKSLQLELYPKLKSTLEAEVTELLQFRLPVTHETVSSFIDIQVAHINTSHPELQPRLAQSVEVNNHHHCPSVIKDGKLVHVCTPQTHRPHLCINLPHDSQLVQHDRNSADFALVEDLIKCYVSIVNKIVEDTIPKIIINSLVNYIVDQIQVVLVKKIHDLGDAESFVCESQKIITKRNEIQAEIDVLEKAENILKALSTTMMESTRLLETVVNQDDKESEEPPLVSSNTSELNEPKYPRMSRKQWRNLMQHKSKHRDVEDD